jgi:hypothetical protein
MAAAVVDFTVSEGHGYPLEVGSQQNGRAVADRGRSRLSARARERSSERGNARAMALVLYNDSQHNIPAL